MAFIGQTTTYQYYIDSKGDIWSSPKKELYYGNIYHGSKEAEIFRASLTGFGDESDSGELGSWFSKLFHQITKKPFTALSHIALAPFTAGASLHPQFFKGTKHMLQAVKTVAPVAAAIVAAPFVLPAIGITSAAGAVSAASTAAGVAQQAQQVMAAKKKAAEQAAAAKQAEQQAAAAQRAEQQAAAIESVQQEIQQAVDTGGPITTELASRATTLGIKGVVPTPARPTTAGMMSGIPMPYILGAGAFLVIAYGLFADRKR